MNLKTLSATTEAVLRELFALSSAEVIDWHPSLEREGDWYQSDICDRLSDALKRAPSSTAREVQQQLANRGILVETDSRGFLFINATQVEVGENEKGFCSSKYKRVFVYVQPPAREFSLYYAKYLAQLGLQIECLRQLGVTGTLYIPNKEPSARPAPSQDIAQFYGIEGFLTLVALLQKQRHEPSLADLASVPVEHPGCSVVFWLTTELLSIDRIGPRLIELRHAITASAPLSLITTCLGGELSADVSGLFTVACKEFGFPALIYLCQLAHALDIDWQAPDLENSLNLCWLLKSNASRLARGRSGNPENNDMELPNARLKFLTSNIHYMRERTAVLGDSAGLVRLLRETGLAQQRALNHGILPEQEVLLENF